MSTAVRRLAVGLEYDGTRYAGWQAQPGLPTIQDSLQQALSAVADHAVAAVAAGRTDAAVHAVGQVAHFDTPAERPLRGWVLGANSHLPPDISVNWVIEVERDFHARYTAQARSYRYCLLQRATRPALLRDRVCWVREVVDVPAMHEAAQALVGEHDFSSFRAVECQSPTPMRHLDSIAVSAAGALVRNIAGSLLQVGEGKRSPNGIGQLLAARDRARAGVTAPAAGLYLWKVRYPPSLQVPDLVPAQPWAMIAGA